MSLALPVSKCRINKGSLNYLPAPAHVVGFAVEDRPKLDTWRKYMFVDIVHPLPADGVIDRVELNVGAAGVNRPLKVATFQQLDECQFVVLSKVSLSGFTAGHNMVR